MLEVCIDTLQDAITAAQAGAQRLELCAALEVGGVTPCGALVSAVRRAVTCPLIVLLRPRSGDFIYDATDRAQIIASARDAMAAGADGLAVGGVTISKTLDIELLQAVAEVAPKCQLVMHRAFDEASDSSRALQELIALGYHRVLTSGGAATAHEGLDVLARLQAEARGRIAIMPGGGVCVSNAAEIVERTKCTELHGSFRFPSSNEQSQSLFGRHRRVDPEAVAACRAALDAVAASSAISPKTHAGL